MTLELWQAAAFVELVLIAIGVCVGFRIYYNTKFRLWQLRKSETKDMARIDELEGYLVNAGIAKKMPDPIHAKSFIGLYGDSYTIPEPEKTVAADGEVEAALKIWEAGVKEVAATTPAGGNTGEATSEGGSDG